MRGWTIQSNENIKGRKEKKIGGGIYIHVGRESDKEKAIRRKRDRQRERERERERNTLM